MPRKSIPPDDRLLLPREVEKMFRVDRATVRRWANDGLIATIRTPGGHRRYSETEVMGLLAGDDGHG